MKSSKLAPKTIFYELEYPLLSPLEQKVESCYYENYYCFLYLQHLFNWTTNWLCCSLIIFCIIEFITFFSACKLEQNRVESASFISTTINYNSLTMTPKIYWFWDCCLQAVMISLMQWKPLSSGISNNKQTIRIRKLRQLISDVSSRSTHQWHIHNVTLVAQSRPDRQMFSPGQTEVLELFLHSKWASDALISHSLSIRAAGATH